MTRTLLAGVLLVQGRRKAHEADSSVFCHDRRAHAAHCRDDRIAIALVVTYTLTWLVRYVVGHRRWIRSTKVQTEVHSRLLERFSSNDELLAYVQSPAGARFLQSAPISLDGSPRAMGSPVSRILWSTQAGVVLTAAGLGMNYVSRHIDPNRADPIFMLSVLLLSIGLGFVASAAMSYLLSKRLGIIGPSGAVEE